jgi:HAD superfamily hydrolase (TIGR01549 family)
VVCAGIGAGRPPGVRRIALLDVDGTLIDTNYHHAIAWYRAFRDHGMAIPVWRLHRHIGMGGDQLVAAVAGSAVESAKGDDLRAAHTQRYKALIDEVVPMADATELLRQLAERGHEVILASSGSADDIAHYRALLDADQWITDQTLSDDVERTKPSPDIVDAALAKARSDGPGVLIGDSTWDCQAARRAGVTPIAVLTGGFSEAELRDAGAADVFESLSELLTRIAETPLA